MRMGMIMRATIKQTQRLVLTQAQRLVVKQQMLVQRLALLAELRQERYEPRGQCPDCFYKLTPEEIIRGFNRDPNDFTTGCPRCKHRFEPRLVCRGEVTMIELPFYCATQVLAMLQGRQMMSPDGFLKRQPALYRSAIVHFGGLKRAFAKIGIIYYFQEVSDWKHKIAPFLGKLSDTVIAGCVGVSPATIGRRRRKANIRRYSVRRALETAEAE